MILGLKDWAFLLFFVGETLLFGTALGLCMMKAKKVLALPKTGLFLLGFALTPFVLGAYMMDLSLLPGGANIFLTILPVWVFIICVAFFRRSFLLGILRRVGQYIMRRFRWVALLALLAISSFLLGLNKVYGFISLPLSTLGGYRWDFFYVLLGAVVLYGIIVYSISRLKAVDSQKLELSAFLMLLPPLLLGLYCLSPMYVWDMEAAIAAYVGEGLLPKLIIMALSGLYGLVMAIPFTLGRFLARSSNFPPKAKSLKAWVVPFVALVVFSILAMLYLKLSIPVRAYIPLFALAAIAVYLCWEALRPQPQIRILLSPVKAAKKSFSPVRQFPARLLNNTSIPKYLFIGVACLAGCYFIYNLTCGLFIKPWYLVDASQYNGEAKNFLDNFSSAGWLGFDSTPNGAVVGTTHHFLWSAFIAFAMRHCIGTPGFGNDSPILAATVISTIFALAAFIALVSLFRNRRAIMLAFILFTGISGTEYIIISRSRDGFRIVGLIFFFLAVVGVMESLKQNKKLHVGHLLFPCAGAFCAMASHPINAIGAVPLVVALVAWVLFRRQFNWRFILVGVACVVGVVLASTGIIEAWLETGNLSGDYIAISDVLAGTPYEETHLAFEQQRLDDTSNYLQRIFYVMNREHGYVMYAGLISAIVLIVMQIRKAFGNKGSMFFLLAGLAVVCNFLMLNDAINWYGFPMTKWLVMNLRYPYHIATFCIFAICALFTALQQRWAGTIQMEVGASTKHLLLKQWATTVVAALLGIAMIVTGSSQYPFYYGSKDDKPAVVDAAYYDHILVDNIAMSYYYDNHTLSLFTPPARDILLAETQEELMETLRAHDIQVIVSNNVYLVYYFIDGPLGEFMTNPDNFDYVEVHDNYQTLYILKGYGQTV